MKQRIGRDTPDSFILKPIFKDLTIQLLSVTMLPIKTNIGVGGNMTPVIRIDDEVMSKLKEHAKILDLVFGTPNEVIRVVLGLDRRKPAPTLEKGSNANSTEAIEIQLDSLYTARKWALIPIPKDKRTFFPGYKVNFDLETDCGVLTTHVTSAPRGTPYGDPKGGAYIQSKLRPWFDNHPRLRDGAKLRIEALEAGKRYKLLLVGSSS